MSTLDHFELSIPFEHHFYHRKRKLIQTVFIISFLVAKTLETPLFRPWVGPSLDYWRGFSVPQPVANFVFHSTEPIPLCTNSISFRSHLV